MVQCLFQLRGELVLDCERCSDAPALPALSYVLLALFAPPQDAADAAALAAVQQAS